jgi:hypothetical protein
MALPSDDRVAALEKEIRDLKTRVAALERLVGSSVPEHDADQAVIQRKVVYDWQG